MRVYRKKTFRKHPGLSESLFVRRWPSGADPGRGIPRARKPMPAVQTLTVFLLMTILAQALFALVRGNFMAFTFFSARHTAAISYEL